MSSEFYEELRVNIKAGIPEIMVVTYEWQRLDALVAKVCKEENRNFYKWSFGRDVKKWNRQEKSFVETEIENDPSDLLKWFIDNEETNFILLLEDFHPFMKPEQFEIIRQLRECTRVPMHLKKSIIVQIPFYQHVRELEKEVPLLELDLPDSDVILKILEQQIDKLEYDNKVNTEGDKDDIVNAAIGMSSVEAEITFRSIIARKGRLTTSEIPLIVKSKEQIIKKEGILEYFHPSDDFSDVGGMDNLKDWLTTRGEAFTQDAKKFGLVSPKGVMLLGVPGCGKSLIAKSIANVWEKPLLKFDLGKVFGGIVGESESNIRKALSLAETVSPSILWIDEIEKGLSGLNGSGDSGTSSRVFGHLLTWMQEKKSDVFVIATANSIEQLPPELLRKGRFDEIFFVDLPSKDERKDIFRIHIEKRDRDFDQFDIDSLVENTVGFSGAEIEEVVNEALFKAYNPGKDSDLKDEYLLEAIEDTYPLSKTMAKTINSLRDWANVRARKASSGNVENLIEDTDKKVPLLKQEKSNPFMD